jgi:DNA-binding NarL/FixJ family response regulator
VRVAVVESAAGLPREVEEALRLHPDITVVGRASSVREALSDGTRPDVVVADGRVLASASPAPDEARPEGLTRREREVVALVAAGRTSREIAEILRVTTRTVESHRKHIRRKLGTRTIAGFTRFAIANGLLEEQ